MSSRAQRPLQSLNSLMEIRYFFGFKAVNSFNGKSMKEFDAEGAYRRGSLSARPAESSDRTRNPGALCTTTGSNSAERPSESGGDQHAGAASGGGSGRVHLDCNGKPLGYVPMPQLGRCVFDSAPHFLSDWCWGWCVMGADEVANAKR